MIYYLRITLLCLLFIATPLFAESTIISAAHFSTIKKIIAQNKHPHHLLLALDNDDTLTMMPCPSLKNCQYLGGPAWFSWQAALPARNPDRIWKTFPQLLAINNLIFTMSKMVLDDPAIPSALQLADQRGAHIVVVTARGDDMSNATEKQLSENHILPFIEKNAIRATHHEWHAKRRVVYSHGILYLAGQNKGEMIKQFLANTHETKRIQQIIFVDDTLQNVKDVANAYKNNPAVHVISIHFTRLATHKANFLKSKKLQQIANQRWFAIRDALRKNLPGTYF